VRRSSSAAISVLLVWERGGVGRGRRAAGREKGENEAGSGDGEGGIGRWRRRGLGRGIKGVSARESFRQHSLLQPLTGPLTVLRPPARNRARLGASGTLAVLRSPHGPELDWRRRAVAPASDPLVASLSSNAPRCPPAGVPSHGSAERGVGCSVDTHVPILLFALSPLLPRIDAVRRNRRPPGRVMPAARPPSVMFHVKRPPRTRVCRSLPRGTETVSRETLQHGDIRTRIRFASATSLLRKFPDPVASLASRLEERNFPTGFRLSRPLEPGRVQLSID
jgi:hypothetical protein